MICWRAPNKWAILCTMTMQSTESMQILESFPICRDFASQAPPDSTSFSLTTRSSSASKSAYASQMVALLLSLLIMKRSWVASLHRSVNIFQNTRVGIIYGIHLLQILFLGRHALRKLSKIVAVLVLRHFLHQSLVLEILHDIVIYIYISYIVYIGYDWVCIWRCASSTNPRTKVTQLMARVHGIPQLLLLAHWLLLALNQGLTSQLQSEVKNYSEKKGVVV